jgi:hypothetical protein
VADSFAESAGRRDAREPHVHIERSGRQGPRPNESQGGDRTDSRRPESRSSDRTESRRAEPRGTDRDRPTGRRAERKRDRDDAFAAELDAGLEPAWKSSTTTDERPRPSRTKPTRGFTGDAEHAPRERIEPEGPKPSTKRESTKEHPAAEATHTKRRRTDEFRAAPPPVPREPRGHAGDDRKSRAATNDDDWVTDKPSAPSKSTGSNKPREGWREAPKSWGASRGPRVGGPPPASTWKPRDRNEPAEKKPSWGAPRGSGARDGSVQRWSAEGQNEMSPQDRRRAKRAEAGAGTPAARTEAPRAANRWGGGSTKRDKRGDAGPKRGRR